MHQLTLGVVHLPNPLCDFMDLSVLSWNCRGAHSARFHRHMRELTRLHKPSVLILLETKTQSSQSISSICKYSNLLQFTCAEAHGYAGGIWVLWDPHFVDLEVVSIDDQIITAIVRCHHTNAWVLSALYASPHVTIRNYLWDFIQTLGRIISLPWLLIGDWNQVVNAEDKQGRRPVSSAQSAPLLRTVTACSLVDLGFLGSRFTWTNKRSGMALIQERIDRVWCNAGWFHLFPTTTVRHLVRGHSDHSPILLTSTPDLHRQSPWDSFHMLSAWFQHKGFARVVASVWAGSDRPLLTDMATFRKLAG